MHEHDVALEYTVRVVTVSTSRFEKYGRVRGVENIPEDDGSGRLIAESFGERVREYVLVPDDVQEIRRAVIESEEDVVVITGGTGLNPKDVTIEAVEPLFDRKIDGFGEIFRLESYKEVGFNALLSRATAGIVDGRVIFCLPGSKNAVRTGLEIIHSVVTHILSHARGMR
ncbi:molybdopterin adenylyltransferase [Geoglobus ahangari]|uniref:Molybdopterin adenylyltransferase n=1 Tax=Geoglobus ahangari TaxID=113653 RepID=A0A0F7IG73_9EURY|nr:MogA/MoaB family molybdenum cofactor biosynthesis protein [Geoglobus ahangari]AKG92545.1 molybdopterin adenylyltransferase [Geoglobus ahangari]